MKEQLKSVLAFRQHRKVLLSEKKKDVYNEGWGSMPTNTNHLSLRKLILPVCITQHLRRASLHQFRAHAALSPPIGRPRRFAKHGKVVLSIHRVIEDHRRVLVVRVGLVGRSRGMGRWGPV
jgi:hypothetical protein